MLVCRRPLRSARVAIYSVMGVCLGPCDKYLYSPSIRFMRVNVASLRYRHLTEGVNTLIYSCLGERPPAAGKWCARCRCFLPLKKHLFIYLEEMGSLSGWMKWVMEGEVKWEGGRRVCFTTDYTYISSSGVMHRILNRACFDCQSSGDSFILKGPIRCKIHFNNVG